MNGCMINTRYYVDDENCVRVTDYYNEIGSVGYKNELIITKEAFIECYNKWIKGEEE